MSDARAMRREDFLARKAGKKVLSSGGGDGDVPARVREACAWVADRAHSVTIERARIEAYAAALPLGTGATVAPDPATHLTGGPPEQLAAFWLTLDAINFGSGWFPTLRKRPGRSGYHTVAGGLRDRFASAAGLWTSDELQKVTTAEIAATLGQDPEHELMALFVASLADLGRHVTGEHDSSFLAVVESAQGSAAALATRLARWDCFADVSTYEGVPIPLYKRAQIAAADLAGAGVARWRDPERLTMFADNLVPHVLRLDGVLHFEADLVARIERGELVKHGSREEVEIRACAVHAVELIVADRPGTTAAEVDRVLWTRGGGPRYKARPRHRARTTAY